MHNRNNRRICWLLFAFLVLIPAIPALAKEGPATATGNPLEHFQPGLFVMDHVADSHEWHLFSYGDKHYSIPLPVILYSRSSGWHVFWSSRFHHGHSTHKNFRIETEGASKGKIAEVNEAGDVVGYPIDLSVTKTVAGIFASIALLLFVFLKMARQAVSSHGKAPRGIQNLLEPVILFIRDEVARPAIGEHHYERFMPFLLSLFFFILFNNLLGLVPVFPFGVNVTGNIAVTLVLALFTFLVTNLNGNRHYWKEIFNPDVPFWLKFPIPLMQIIELSGVFTKPFVLMVRLFANMMAGHLIVMVFISLIFIFTKIMGMVGGLVISPVSVLFSVFMIMLDILVSFIQAYVFTLLSAIYFGMAKAENH